MGCIRRYVIYAPTARLTESRLYTLLQSMHKLLKRLLNAVGVVCVAAAMLPSSAHAQEVNIDEYGIDGDQAQRNWWEDDPWTNPERGFNWYPPDRPDVKKKKQAKPAEKKVDLKSLKSFDEVNKEVTRLREVAIFNPTEENVLAYMKAQEYVMSKSAMFADVARRVVWKNPEIDGNARQPIASYAALSKRERITEKRNKTMEEIAVNHGLVFFFRSDCPFCHDMAPVVKSLSDRYGIEVIAVSMDGGNLPSYPRPRPDNGISKFVSNGQGVPTVPALYLVSNDSKSVTLVGVGALAGNEITERIRVLTTTKPGEEM